MSDFITFFKQSSTKNQIGLIFLFYAGLCFMTSLYFNSSSGDVIKGNILTTGGEIGPINVEKDNAVYSIKVNQKLNQSGDWSFVSGDVLGANKEYLFGFGKEFWRESGYDGDGPWHESVDNFEMKVNFYKAGIYYLSFNTEMSSEVAGSEVNVTVEPRKGSSLAHLILGIFSIIIGLIILFFMQDTGEGGNRKKYRDNNHDTPYDFGKNPGNDDD
ncbi:MAG: hypothetical protein ACQ9MH_13235 [Nitrospinales bacterium]